MFKRTAKLSEVKRYVRCDLPRLTDNGVVKESLTKGAWYGIWIYHSGLLQKIQSKLSKTMTHRKKNLLIGRTFLILAASGIILAGCKNMNKTQKGAVIGTAGGAAVGAVIGKAAGIPQWAPSLVPRWVVYREPSLERKWISRQKKSRMMYPALK
jgi:hypothetical protein